MRESFKSIALKSFVIIVFASFLSFISLLIRPGLFDLWASAVEKQKPTEQKQSAPVLAGVANISLKQAKEYFDSQRALFLDARESAEYLKGHIKGAKSLPYDEFDEKYISVLGAWKTDDLIITYCSGEGCNSSVMLAKRLKEAGYNNVMIFYGGWPEWQKASYPIESLSSNPFGGASF